MAFPLTRQSFVVKPLDGAQSGDTRNAGNVFPFLVTLQNLNRNRTRKLLVNAMVFLYLPHTTLWIYHEWYVKGDGFRVKHNGFYAHLIFNTIIKDVASYRMVWRVIFHWAHPSPQPASPPSLRSPRLREKGTRYGCKWFPGLPHRLRVLSRSSMGGASSLSTRTSSTVGPGWRRIASRSRFSKSCAVRIT